jgi:hypothetical protein
VTRSRPYHSDDNAHVEQKNWMWPQQLLGCGRLEEAAMVEPINQIYREIWGPLHNFFLRGENAYGSRWQRKHDRPQTAYQRLLNSHALGPKVRRQLREQFATLDPFALHEQLEKCLRPVLSKALE